MVYIVCENISVYLKMFFFLKKWGETTIIIKRDGMSCHVNLKACFLKIKHMLLYIFQNSYKDNHFFHIYIVYRKIYGKRKKVIDIQC